MADFPRGPPNSRPTVDECMGLVRCSPVCSEMLPPLASCSQSDDAAVTASLLWAEASEEKNGVSLAWKF